MPQTASWTAQLALLGLALGAIVGDSIWALTAARSRIWFGRSATRQPAALPRGLDRPVVVPVPHERESAVDVEPLEDSQRGKRGPGPPPSSAAGDLDPFALTSSPRLAEGVPGSGGVRREPEVGPADPAVGPRRTWVADSQVQSPLRIWGERHREPATPDPPTARQLEHTRRLPIPPHAPSLAYARPEQDYREIDVLTSIGGPRRG